MKEWWWWAETQVEGRKKRVESASQESPGAMIVSVKLLQGGECSLEVSESDLVSRLKELVERELKVPSEQQRLLFKGKPLMDELQLSDYSIPHNARLNLVLKATERGAVAPTLAPESPTAAAPAEGDSTFWELLPLILAKHFSPSDAHKVLQQFKKDYDWTLKSLSLDDVERIATHLLHADTPATARAGSAE